MPWRWGIYPYLISMKRRKLKPRGKCGECFQVLFTWPCVNTRHLGCPYQEWLLQMDGLTDMSQLCWASRPPKPVPPGRVGLPVPPKANSTPWYRMALDLGNRTDHWSLCLGMRGAERQRPWMTFKRVFSSGEHAQCLTCQEKHCFSSGTINFTESRVQLLTHPWIQDLTDSGKTAQLHVMNFREL